MICTIASHWAPSIRGRAGEKPSQKGLAFGSVVRLPLVGLGAPQRSGAKTKTFHERKNKTISAPRRSPAFRWSALNGGIRIRIPGKETRMSDSCSIWHRRQRSGTQQKGEYSSKQTVVSGRFSGSLTIGNENPFQAHFVLESSSDFRLILRLENAVPEVDRKRSEKAGRRNRLPHLRVTHPLRYNQLWPHGRSSSSARTGRSRLSRYRATDLRLAAPARQNCVFPTTPVCRAST